MAGGVDAWPVFEHPAGAVEAEVGGGAPLAHPARSDRLVVWRLRPHSTGVESTSQRSRADAQHRAYRAATEVSAAPLVARAEAIARRSRMSVGATPVEAVAAADATRLGLTSREAEVLSHVAAGRTNRQIRDRIASHLVRCVARSGMYCRIWPRDAPWSANRSANFWGTFQPLRRSGVPTGVDLPPWRRGCDGSPPVSYSVLVNPRGSWGSTVDSSTWTGPYTASKIVRAS